MDVYVPLAGNAKLELVTDRSPDALDIYRHSCAHLMANAVKELFPGGEDRHRARHRGRVLLRLRPGRALRPEELEAIEARMAEIIARDTPIRREEMPWEEAKALFDDEQEPYKSELAYERGQHEPVSIYRQGAFNDFCRGPHLPSTGKIKPGTFKLLSVAGAYWQGDETEQAAPAHLRHRLPHEEGARRAPQAPGGGQAARPPQARQGAEALPHRRGGGLGPHPLDPQRAPSSGRTPGLHRATSSQAGLLPGLHAPHRQARRSTRPRGTSPTTRTRSSRPSWTPSPSPRPSRATAPAPSS